MDDGRLDGALTADLVSPSVFEEERSGICGNSGPNYVSLGGGMPYQNSGPALKVKSRSYVYQVKFRLVHQQIRK